MFWAADSKTMGVDFIDDRGLICGFSLPVDGPPAAIERGALQPPSRAPAPTPEHPYWLHFNLNDARARDWIANCHWLAQESRDAFLSTDHSIRVETSGNGFFLVLSEAYADDHTSFGVLHVYIDDRCILTGRRHPLGALRLLRSDLAASHPITTTSGLFIRLIEHSASTFAKTVLGFADLIDDMEERVFSEHYREVTSLGQQRLLMARVRRQRSATRQVLTDALDHLPPWWGKKATSGLRRVISRLTSAAQDLDLAADRARLLNEEIDSRMAKATNRNLYFVSVAAALFLPITLISGVFGMNVGGLPWVETERGFLWVMGCMLASVIIVTWVLRRRDML